MNVSRRTPVRRWTARDLENLRVLAASHTAHEIARLLQRTVQAVRTKAAQERVALRLDALPGPRRAPFPWERADE